MLSEGKKRALAAALRANLREAVRGTPPIMAARILAGESDDERLSLMVKAADALEVSLTVPDGGARELIAEARSNEHTFGTPAGGMRLIRRLADALEASLPVRDGDARERLIQIALAHVPILGVSGTGKIVGCRCMDRVFVRDRETWSEHIADAVLVVVPVLGAAAPEEEWEYRYAEKLGDTEYTYGPEHDENGWFSTVEEATAARIEDTDYVVRRRPAGPVEPLPAGGDDAA